jgi:hypothetical protein
MHKRIQEIELSQELSGSIEIDTQEEVKAATATATATVEIRGDDSELSSDVSIVLSDDESVRSPSSLESFILYLLALDQEQEPMCLCVHMQVCARAIQDIVSILSFRSSDVFESLHTFLKTSLI